MPCCQDQTVTDRRLHHGLLDSELALVVHLMEIPAHLVHLLLHLVVSHLHRYLLIPVIQTAKVHHTRVVPGKLLERVLVILIALTSYRPGQQLQSNLMRVRRNFLPLLPTRCQRAKLLARVAEPRPELAEWTLLVTDNHRSAADRKVQ